ncbi:MAG: hypothetical protein OEQ53_09325, partial [Saprospiraceae bacterium]|nr:hypothetical protein [Saprospiraceae bacterium]
MAERKLAAIMFTDIVGYSSLMQKEEAQAITAVDKHERVVNACAKEQLGEVLHYYGDGSLTIFPSVTQALRSSIKIQTLMQEDPPVPLRIGVHVGEVLIDGDKVFGDGINIASRIESTGTSGSVLLSQNVFEKVSNQPEFACQWLGQFGFKNIEQDIDLYALCHPLLIVPGVSELKGKRRDNGIESIAVFPFRNLSNDPLQIYFCHGICEEIIHALGRIPNLKVASRSSVFSLWEQNQDASAIGLQLGVSKILEGSVRKVEDRIRINVQLSAVSDGLHLWSEKFDSTVEEIFEIQDEITAVTAKYLGTNSKPESRSIVKVTSDVDAYDTFLQAKYYFNKRSIEGNTKAMALLERSVKADPDFALGFATLARVYIEQYFTYDPKEEWEKKAFVALEKSKNLDPDLADIYLAKGNLIWTRENRFPHADAITEYLQAIDRNPDFAEAYNELARVAWHVGLLDLAYASSLKATQIDPYFADGHFRFGWLEMHRGNYETALALLKRVPKGSLAPSTDVLTAQTLMYMGRKSDAFATLDAVPMHLRMDTDYCGMRSAFYAIEGDKIRAEKEIQAAIQYGQKLGHFHHVTCNIAEAYALMKNVDQALYWLNIT